jgi:Type III restriction enzyme, res subunit
MESAFTQQLGYFVLGLPPGAGKTLVCILFCMLKVAQKYNVIIIASPLCVQVAQTKERFDALLTYCGVKFTSTLVDSDGDTSANNVCADRKAGYVHYVHTTYRSAENVAEAMTEANTVLSFFDEAHRYTAQQLACLLEITQDVVLVSGTWRSIHADVLCNVDEDSKSIMSITEAEQAGIIMPQRFVIPAFVDMDIDVAKLGCEVQAEFIATATMRLDNGPRRLILYSATVADAKLMSTLTVQEFARSGMKAEARVLVNDV